MKSTCSGKAIDDIQRRGLVASGIGAARRRWPARGLRMPRRRSEALLGKDAGREHAYTQFVAGMDKDQKKHISDFLRAGGLKELAADARGTVTLGLLDADLSPEDARQTLKSLDSRLNEIARLSSFDRLDGYMNTPSRGVDWQAVWQPERHSWALRPHPRHHQAYSRCWC